MTQPHGTNIWQEPAGAGATPTLTQMVLQDVGDATQHVASGAPTWIAVDLGDGAATLIDVTTEFFLRSIAGTWQLSDTGPADAVLVDVGGALVPTAIGPGVVQAARYFADGSGIPRAVRLDAAQLDFVQVRGTVLSY